MRNSQINTTQVLKILGILLMLIACVFVFSVQCINDTQLFIVYAFVGVGIALISIRKTDKTRVSIKLLNFSIFLFGGVALPFLLFFYDPVGRFKRDNCFKKQSVTVFVHGNKGLQDMVLRQKGHVIMDIDGERKRSLISENGEAYFANLQFGNKVRLNIDFSEPYRSLFPDSIYSIDETGKIYLAVALQGIGKISGIVLYHDQPLNGVAVRVYSLSSNSDSTGQFTVNIPDSLQSNKYTVWFSKKGFKSVSKEAYPQTGIPLGIMMEKIR